MLQKHVTSQTFEPKTKKKLLKKTKNQVKILQNLNVNFSPHIHSGAKENKPKQQLLLITLYTNNSKYKHRKISKKNIAPML